MKYLIFVILFVLIYGKTNYKKIFSSNNDPVLMESLQIKYEEITFKNLLNNQIKIDQELKNLKKKFELIEQNLLKKYNDIETLLLSCIVMIIIMCIYCGIIIRKIKQEKYI